MDTKRAIGRFPMGNLFAPARSSGALPACVQNPHCLEMMKLISQSQGYQRVTGVETVDDFVALAKKVGTIKRGHGREIVERIFPRDTAVARPRSFGSVYGTGSYPLHTDTAHWPLPSRCVLLRVVGDLRRTTTICSSKDLLDSMTHDQISAVKSSVWYSNFGEACFTCSMLFRHKSEQVMRFDPQCMRPANAAAYAVSQWLPGLLQGQMQTFEWHEGESLVLYNWHVLHGRGQQPCDEGHRELQRIYVE